MFFFVARALRKGLEEREREQFWKCSGSEENMLNFLLLLLFRFPIWEELGNCFGFGAPSFPLFFFSRKSFTVRPLKKKRGKKQLLELQRNRRWKGVFAFAPLLLSPFPTKAGANGEFTATTKAPDLGKEMGVAFELGWVGFWGWARADLNPKRGVRSKS